MINHKKAAFKANLAIAGPIRAKGMIADLLREKGYRVRRVGRGKDRGVDMILTGGGRRVALILKLHSKRVGAGEVQKAEGARKEVEADDVWIFSLRGFTEDGKEAGRKIGVRCLDADAIWVLRSVKPVVLEFRTA